MTEHAEGTYVPACPSKSVQAIVTDANMLEGNKI